MSVDSAAAAIDAPISDTAGAAVVDNDAALDAIYDKHERDNGAERAADGKFASPRPAQPVDGNRDAAGTENPLEGGEGEVAGDTGSTPQSAVPLPSTMRGLEEVWEKIPAELRGPIADHQGKLRETLSKQGTALASWKPIGDAVDDFKEYFDGTRAKYSVEEAIRASFETVRGLDERPLETWLDVARQYNLLPQLMQVFAPKAEGQAGDQPAPQENTALLAKIGELERTIGDLTSKSRPESIDERINLKLIEAHERSEAQSAITRTSKDMPLMKDIPEDDLVHFINRSWRNLGEAASKEDVLKAAYDMAVNADPHLRTRQAALKSPAPHDPTQIAAAKRANATNIRSTSVGRPREQTEDELLDAIYDKHERA